MIAQLPATSILSLGLGIGRNTWKTDLTATLDWLESVQQSLRSWLLVMPSCSLLHVPVDLASEQMLDLETLSWLAFARQNSMKSGYWPAH